MLIQRGGWVFADCRQYDGHPYALTIGLEAHTAGPASLHSWVPGSAAEFQN